MPIPFGQPSTNALTAPAKRARVAGVPITGQADDGSEVTIHVKGDALKSALVEITGKHICCASGCWNMPTDEMEVCKCLCDKWWCLDHLPPRHPLGPKIRCYKCKKGTCVDCKS